MEQVHARRKGGACLIDSACLSGLDVTTKGGAIGVYKAGGRSCAVAL